MTEKEYVPPTLEQVETVARLFQETPEKFRDDMIANRVPAWGATLVLVMARCILFWRRVRGPLASLVAVGCTTAVVGWVWTAVTQ